MFGSGDQKISWVSYKDVAAIAIAAAESADARNRTIEVGGPEALSPNEVIRIFEDRAEAQVRGPSACRRRRSGP